MPDLIQSPRSRRTRVPRAAALLAVSVLASVGLAGFVGVPQAHAAGRVTVDNGGRGAVIDSRYSSTLTVTGRGFQSIKGGHGGVYVWFGTVDGRWQPSKGGKSGVDYVYVPDSESKSNAGFQRYVAFPGSDTAAAANGGMLSADGSFTVRLLVPGPTFQGVGRDGSVRTVDCRKVTCGVITVGAHGVHNANNETFTPVGLRELSGGGQQAEQPATTDDGTGPVPAVGAAGPGSGERGEVRVPRSGAAGQGVTAVRARGKARLDVDRPSAVAGRGLSFVASGLVPGEQVTAILDDGLVASGPHLVGSDGRVAGVLALPSEVAGGTHELRLFGAGRTPSVRFAIVADPDPDPASSASGTEQTDDRAAVAATAFAVGAGVLFCGALFMTVRRFTRSRRALA
ncbi:hypothetical protein [Nocardioides campestrisoli]|uniref:hypothetical protein n=1 Tax=Nocardioides campestrisoli TaxID=2736757 RepID=UPI00163DE5BF|nr:hypothetical protein [Nocardioides campestrisoli]